MAKRNWASGKCNLCDKTYSKAGMSRHLKSCLQKHAPAAGKKIQETFWLKVTSKYYGDYWLHLEIPAKATFLDLDQYLRDIWLECCGHLSAFSVGNTRYELDTGMVDAMWKDFFGPSASVESMDTRLDSILEPGVEFEHEYDFGTTTHLELKVMGEHARAGRNNDIRLLARNEPPDIRCAECEKPATWVCVQCIYKGPEAWLCNDHIQEHKCGDEMALPVVNSPRVGECGYTG